jgi:hypothetical protein
MSQIHAINAPNIEMYMRKKITRYLKKNPFLYEGMHLAK